MSNDPGVVAHIEHVSAHRLFTERVFIDVPFDVDQRAVDSWRGWFASWEPLREGDELGLTLEDGRRGRAVVDRVHLDFDLVDPIVSFTGTSPLTR